MFAGNRHQSCVRLQHILQRGLGYSPGGRPQWPSDAQRPLGCRCLGPGERKVEGDRAGRTCQKQAADGFVALIIGGEEAEGQVACPQLCRDAPRRLQQILGSRLHLHLAGMSARAGPFDGPYTSLALRSCITSAVFCSGEMMSSSSAMLNLRREASFRPSA